jgi:hypothetical protein
VKTPQCADTIWFGTFLLFPLIRTIVFVSYLLEVVTRCYKMPTQVVAAAYMRQLCLRTTFNQIKNVPRSNVRA